MSETHRARKDMGNVLKQASLPKRTNGGAHVEKCPYGQEKPKKEPALLRMPDMSQIPLNQQVDNELMFTREVLCAMIKQAYLDAKNDTEYVTAENQRARELNQRSAIEFLNSEFYRDLCTALGDCSGVGLPPDKIKKEALK